MIYQITNTTSVSPLFDGWDETFIWSCLQGVMGSIYADHPRTPTAAMAVLGDFSFLAGTPNAELISFFPHCPGPDYRIVVPQNEDWNQYVLSYYGSHAATLTRYAFQKDSSGFHEEKLQQAVSRLPAGYKISMIDESFYHKCKDNAWSADLVSQFSNYEDYHRLGLGAVVHTNNEIVSGASSYCRYRQGIEIEVDTREDYRRKGLAYACSAKLILECLKRGLYPSWDAHSKGSAALAAKLGYHYSHSYRAVEIRNN